MHTLWPARILMLLRYAVAAAARAARQWWLAAVSIAFVMQAAAAYWLTGGELLDDAYISMRYAANLAAGHGPLYNPGGPPVEGYTNPLWVAWLALWALAGADLPTAAAVSSLLAAAAGVWATARLTNRLRPGAGPLAALALCVAPAWVHLGMLGLETAAFGAALAFATEAFLARYFRRAGFWFLALATLRPDGLLPWGVATLWLAGQRNADALRRLLFPAAPLYGLFFLARWVYYGDIVPNTFRVKTGGGIEQVQRGTGYLFSAGWEAGLPLWAVWGLLGWWLWRRRGAHPAAGQRLVAALLGSYLAYVVAVGGDAFGPRFLAHVLPLAAALAWSPPLPGAGAPRVLARLVMVAAMGLPVIVGTGIYAMAMTEAQFTAAWAQAGRVLAASAPPGATLATDAAGALPYFSGLPAIDRLGLNDRMVAMTPTVIGTGRPGHERSNDAYVLSLRPTYFACWDLSRGQLNCGGGDAPKGYAATLLVGVRARSPNAAVLPVPPGVDAAWLRDAWERGYQYVLYRREAAE